MVAGIRESDDPALPLGVNTYVWPTCTWDPAPLVAANKMVKCAVFPTHTHTAAAVPKRGDRDRKLPNAVLYTLAYKNDRFTSKFNDTKVCCKELKRKMQLTLPSPNLWVCRDKLKWSFPLDKLWLHSVPKWPTISDAVCLVTGATSPQNPNNRARCSLVQAAQQAMSLCTCKPEMVQTLWFIYCPVMTSLKNPLPCDA